MLPTEIVAENATHETIAVGAVPSFAIYDIVCKDALCCPHVSVARYNSSPGAVVDADSQTRAFESVALELLLYKNIPLNSESPAVASAADTSSKRLFITPVDIVNADRVPPRAALAV